MKSQEENSSQIPDDLCSVRSDRTEENVAQVSQERVKEEKTGRGKFKPMGWIIIQKKSIGEPIVPSYSTGRLIDVFTKAGFEMELVSASNVDVYLTDDDRKSVLVDGKVRRLPTFVLARTGAKTDFYTLAVYRHLEKLDVPVINSSQSIED
ncbi:ribosomal protein S6 modification protein, partial [Reticulomyxa filosa]